MRTSPDAKGKEQLMSWDSRTIMLVDGSDTLRYYYAILLKRLEFTVMVAESAEEALRLMESTIPSLILTDIALPQMTGIDFIKTVKNSDRIKKVPIVVLADRDAAATKSACLGMGCFDFLIKHVEPGNLYRSIQSALVPTPRAHIRLSLPLKVVVGDGTSRGGAERTEFATTISEGGIYSSGHSFPVRKTHLHRFGYSSGIVRSEQKPRWYIAVPWKEILPGAGHGNEVCRYLT